METLPKDIKLLRHIKSILDELMKDRYTHIEIRLNELYEYLEHDDLLLQEFPNAHSISRFLRAQHLYGIMKQIIPNYRVDTSDFRRFQWYFSKEVTPKLANTIQSESFISKNMYHKYGKQVLASNGEMLRSEQEKSIYECLLQYTELTIQYDFPITIKSETKIVDFFIRNNKMGTKFIWEHFGMTNSVNYMNEMTDKIDWYNLNGYIIDGNERNLIYTIYENDSSFYKDIDKYIHLILDQSGQL
ncbi:MAG: hypothetical protein H6605_04610 [Flavobacteriales bacterium]|nr:hypothetical protein [Flavobacteriales bacterium]